MSWWKQFRSLWNDKFKSYTDTFQTREWFDQNYDRVRSLFEDRHVRDVVFAPIKKAVKLIDATTDSEVRATIAAVALANAIMAGLPGNRRLRRFIDIDKPT